VTSWSGEGRKTLAEFRAACDHNSARYYAAFTAYEYVRAWEALGQRPEMKQVKQGKQGTSFLNSDDPDAAWAQLEDAIVRVLADPSPPTVTTPALPFARPVDESRGRMVAQPAPRDPAEIGAEPAARPPAERGGLFRRLLAATELQPRRTSWPRWTAAV
jgi:hypothetical protein